MKTDLSGASAPLRVSPLVADGLLIRQDEYYKKYFYAEILWIEASGNYCYFHFKDKSRITVACRLGSVERQLPDAYLVRVHRGFILNLRYVDTWAGN
ncbi:LytR/AlgR family response regulator transcription factor, partial [Butyricimonas synergistica]